MIQRSDTFPLIVEVIGGVAAQAHEVGLVRGLFGGQGLFGLHIVDVFPDFLRAYFFVEVAVRQQKHRPQLIVAEIAAGAFHSFFALSVTVNHPFDTLGGDTVGVVHHLNKNELAVSAVGLVHVEYGVGGGAGTGEGVKDDGIFLHARNCQQIFDKSNRLCIVEIEIQFLQFSCTLAVFVFCNQI